MILRSKETDREAEIRVAFLDDDLNFWKTEFPAPPSPAERPLELVLECGSCGETVTLLNGDYEFDVCAIRGGLVQLHGMRICNGVEAAGSGRRSIIMLACRARRSGKTW
jgi:hypothetical protein